jgi:hypothetical protein
MPSNLSTGLLAKISVWVHICCIWMQSSDAAALMMFYGRIPSQRSGLHILRDRQYIMNYGSAMIRVAAMQIADFKTIVFRQQLLGFNAVRLPMTFSDLNLTPKSWTFTCTDDTQYLKVSASSRFCMCSMSLLQASREKAAA